MAKKWKFVTPKDRAVTAASTVVGISALGAGLGLLFSPAVIGIAAGYAALSSVVTSRKRYRKRYVEKLVKKGMVSPVPDNEPIAILSAEVSKQLGRPQPPRIFILKNSTDSGFFAALPGTDTILTSRASLRRKLSESEMRFIAAHEMSHLQAQDNKAGVILGRQTLPAVIKGVWLAAGVCLGAAALGLSVPFSASTGLLGIAAFALLPITKMAEKLNSRICERRADRNAIYITRDMESAKSALLRIANYTEKMSRFGELFLSHPSYTPRIKAMAKVFNKVSAVPVLPGTMEALEKAAAQRKMHQPKPI